MIGTAKKQKDDARARIRELFRLANEAKQAHLDATARIERLEAKAKELDADLPSLRGALKAAEYEWKLAMGRGAAGEGGAEAIAATEAGIDAAQKAIDVNRATLVGVEDLLSQAINEAPGLGLRAESALLAAWRAVSDHLEPEARAAAEKFRRFYAAEINAIVSPEGVPPDAFLKRHIDLRGSHLVAAELEAEFRG
ncbi:MAG: hypothetical protein WC978_00220 [bacterium]